ncbi:MAG: hypothetical protein QY309_03455 [Cyclobacteriaceae bacterium]|nr:MAG: hypothetical protein QY309_03455 [Cyclobacteriaceae bacterium]
MLKQSKELQLFLRYGLSRKKDLLKDMKPTYDGLIIPANILLYQYKGTPAVIYTTGQPFAVDPMSFLFAHPLSDFKKRIAKGSQKFKPSFAKLVTGYGENPEFFLSTDYRTLVEYLTKNEKRLSPFVDNCLEFQWSLVQSTISKSKDLLPEGVEPDVRPAFLAPPYFAYSAGDGAAKLNAKILEYVASHERWKKLDLFPVIFAERKNLNDEFVEHIRTEVTKYNFKGHCIWIDNFDERDARKNEIISLGNLIKLLARDGKQTLIMYGGFFSMLFFKFGLTGISHGIAYSESKSMFSMVRQSSGAAPVRYYIPMLHQFVTIENALTILRVRQDLVCDCPVCKKVMRGDIENITRFLKEEELAEIHFLLNREKEKKLVSGFENLNDIVHYLDYILDLNKGIDAITRKYKISETKYEDRPIVTFEAMKAWKSAFEDMNK